MKKIYSICAAVLFAGAINAQQLDVIDLLFSEPGGNFQSPMNDTALEKGDTARLWFIVTNNLSGMQGLTMGDSLTFGWSVDGNNRGNLIMNNLSANISNGSNLNAYLTNSFLVPNTAGTNFEVCTWPLYNPYQPNTDPMVGRHCTTFKTKSETTGGGGGGGGTGGGGTGGGDTNATSINLIDIHGLSNFYVNDRSIEFKFASSHVSNSIELIDLTGKVILSENVAEEEGSVAISEEVAPGFYLLRAFTVTDSDLKKVYVK